MASQPVTKGSLIDQTLGHYRITEKIGSGGMGEVYRAHDEHLARDVAIKILAPGTLIDQSARKHFHKEALILSQLNHPNIATIYDFDTQQGVDFLVMEYISGTSLNEKVAAEPLPEKEVVHLGLQLAEGLCSAHEHGVIHRDLKPGNLRLTSGGRLKILDFGLAKLRLPLTASTATESFTETQAMAGTLSYMAPEQLLGEEIDARTDIHAAGSVLYEMATGQRPFSEVERSQLIGAILRRPPRPPTALNPEMSPELERIIGKCLEKEPENRYQSAKELAVDLRRMAISGSCAQAPVAGQSRKAWAWKAALAFGLGALLVGGGLLLRVRRAHALAESDTILLADFVNKTSDPVFDDALKQALAVELGQSPFLNVLSDRKVSATLRMMGHPANERVSMDIGRELCLRTGSKALLDGTISSLGRHYLVQLNAVACETGDTLAQEKNEAPSKEDVLKALSRASSSLRVKLGESLRSVQKFEVPFEATTSSLEALKSYSMGVKIEHEKGQVPSIPFYKRAIELDPNFPLAYVMLAVTYRNLSQPSLALEYATKAYQLRDRASEREKLRISATYFEARGELEKTVQNYELWIANYPRVEMPHTNLATNYSFMGQYDKALTEYQEALRIAPDAVVTYGNLGLAYLNLNRLEEAKATLDQAFAHKLESGALHWNMYVLAFLRGDAAQMEQQLAWSSGKPEDEDLLLSAQSDTEVYYGRLSNGRDFSRRAVDSAVRADSKEKAALWQVNAALREAELGNTVSARQGATAALALYPGRDVKVVAALALARSGDASRAKVLAVEMERSYPTHTMLKFYWLPTIDAAIELGKGNSSKAVEDLEAAVPYEMGLAQGFINYMYPVYVRGQAYLMADDGTAAAAEFQKLLNHRGIVQNFVTGSLAHLQIGRAYAMSGDTTKAKAAYEDFLTLWKDADPDIPILKQAKAEYAKLQ